MAEFKLGRIKFVWKNEWVTGTQYIKDDVIRYSGKTYICVVGHTASSNFNTDLNFNPTRWNLVSDGQKWTGDWTGTTAYEKGDLVKYGGNVYLCTTAHTSASTVSAGLEANAASWQIFVEGFEWKGDWAISTRYKVNDIVSYGGINYICVTYHTSAATTTLGLETDQSKWDEFSTGVDYKGTWVTATRYKLNDIVKYGGGLWICTAYHSSGATFSGDSANWNQFVEGLEFESTWSAGVNYQPGDVVKYGGNQYVSKTQHSGSNPVTGTTNWDLFSEGLKFRSSWSISSSYLINEVVKLNGYNYVANIDSPSATQTITATSATTKYFTCTSTASMVADMAISFSGSTFGNVFTNGTYYIKQIVNGTQFTVTTIVGGAAFTPTTATGTMTATFAAKPPQATYWTALSNGINWRGYWEDDTEYVVGDSVRYENNTYICKLAHRSEGDDGSTVGATGGGQSLSRPDHDKTGTYWNVLSVGSETAVLNTLGDLVYYDGAGPTRLPIGTEGQILRVSSDLKPEWVTWGNTDHVYWVGEHGVDLPYPTHGSTFDKPWKSIRYAAMEIEKGCRNPNAKHLLEMNRLFIQRETTQWINYQITNNISPFTTAFTYNETKCERDIGWVIDALAYDISHGGNVRTRGAALSYVNALTEECGTYSKLNAESAADVACYNYMLTVIASVLSNDAPAQAYQNVSEDSTNIYPQHIDTDYVAEDTALTEITSLVGIITAALTDKTATNIPERIAAFNTVHVLTGRYREVLPIIVPESTVILGDEVRSTNAGPAGSLISKDDAKYSVAALGRLETITGQIVQGQTVTKSSGNTLSQSQLVPVGQAQQDTLVRRLVRTMQHRIDFITAQTNMIFKTDPTGYNTTFLAGYKDARTLVYENKDFVKAEIGAYIDLTYPNVKYSRTKCKRDVGYVIDALCYDLTYGGNTQMLNAALAYFDGPGTNLVTSATEATANIAAYTRLKTILQQITANTTVSKTAGNTATQWTYASLNGSSANTFIGQELDLIINMLTANNTNTRPSITVTTITSSTTFTASAAHGLSAGDVVVPTATSLKGVIRDTKYYVQAIGLTSTQFKLSTSYGGSDLTVTNGTGLSIVFYKESRPALTNGVTTTTALINTYVTLSAAIPQIKVDVIDYLNTNYGTFKYNSVLCRRDSYYLIDAAYYDSAFGTNFWARENGISYLRGQSQGVIDYQLQAELGSINYIKAQVASSLVTDATAVTRSNACYTEIVDIINNGLAAVDAISWTDPGVDANRRYAREQLQTNRTFIINTISTWLVINYNSVWIGLGAEGQALCQRDIGYTIDALSYDVQYGGNLATRNVARALFDNRTGTSVYPDSQQKAASAAMYSQLGTVAGQVVRELYSGQDTSGTAASATEQSKIVTLCGNISSVITADTLSGLVAEDKPLITWAAQGIQDALLQLSLDKDFIVQGTLQYITDNFNTFSYNQTKCARDVEIIVDAVSYDYMMNSNHQTVKAGYSYLRASASEVFSLNQKAATRDALSLVKTKALANVGGNATAQSRITSLMQTLDDILFGATTEGSTCSQAEPNTDYAIYQLENNRDFIVKEIESYIDTTFSATVTNVNASSDVLTCSDTSWMQRNAAIQFSGTVFGGFNNVSVYYVQNIINGTTFTVSSTRNSSTPDNLIANASGSMTVKLYYDKDFCLRDVHSYIDALKYDLRFTGNYKTSLAARYYANAVIGSYEEDMYYLRNATGIRNQTLEGLTGDLLAPNSYGTSRVSAGAYCSLDPGYGPADYHTWIISRSPYVQNVCTFGYAAVGQKVDGDLHNGGNRSITSNDFTQIISDGIGAWITNNARAELVSVFTYYSHVGYLAENGGRIRGTNGNNSYGDFGSVAEGYDETETPITAVVNNKNYIASVGSTLTDGINQLWQIEYANAGQDYTYATWSFGGAGTGLAVEHDEFRDDGVFQVYLNDNTDDSTNAPEVSGNLGGYLYMSNSNVAQAGTTTQITIAATDDEIASAYPTMRIVLTSGTGAGQYGIINTYNVGTKVATVIKESDGTAGWDHYVPGTTIVAPDASTSYTIEPRLTFSSPTYSSAAATLATAATYSDAAWASSYGVYYPITGTTAGEGTGARFSVVRSGTKYLSVTVIAGYEGVNYKRLDTITLSGSSLGGSSPANDITITLTTVNSLTGAIVEFEYDGYATGGYFVALPNTGQTVNVSTDGISWTQRATVLPSSVAWKAIAVGDIVDTSPTSAGFFVTGRAYKINTVATTQWTNIGHPASANLQVKIGDYFIATGPGTGSGSATSFARHAVAIASASNVTAYSTNGGYTWTAGATLPSSGTWSTIAYGRLTNGSTRWVALKANSTECAFTANGAQSSWTTGGALPASSNWSSIAYGKGKFVAIASGTNSFAYSTDGGATWTAGSLPNVGTNLWASVAYGNNRFVAVSATSGTTAAYSLDGITWTSATLSVSAAYSSVRYGQGVFLAVNDSNNASSSEDGIKWTTRALTRGSGTGFLTATFGNPSRSGIWAAIPSASTTAASYALLGCTTKARAYVQTEKIYAIRIIEPGSGYSSAPTMTIVDPNNLYEAPFTVRKGKGVLAQPSYRNRGTGYNAVVASIDTGDGYADNFQSGSYIAVSRLSGTPQAGANVVFDSQPNTTYKLVQVLSLTGSNAGSIKAFFQISPEMPVYYSPAQNTGVTTRIRYSQVRLTGHDFLDIGTGNFDETNYPNGTPENPATQANETVDNNGGRVFYTSTDQDGNFRVGELFTIEQSTGVATLNADAFNIAGLTELTLGAVTLGGSSATITEFSTDPFFTANSDSVVPTQRAIKAYIAAQIGGGGASLNVNSVVAGFIEIQGSQISTTTGGTISMKANFNFQGGVRGLPVAWNYFFK